MVQGEPGFDRQENETQNVADAERDDTQQCGGSRLYPVTHSDHKRGVLG